MFTFGHKDEFRVLEKIWTIFANENNREIARWNLNGTYLIVVDNNRFQLELCPLIFEGCTLSFFVYFLKTCGFRFMRYKGFAAKHPFFLRHNFVKMKEIKLISDLKQPIHFVNNSKDLDNILSSIPNSIIFKPIVSPRIEHHSLPPRVRDSVKVSSGSMVPPSSFTMDHQASSQFHQNPNLIYLTPSQNQQPAIKPETLTHQSFMVPPSSSSFTTDYQASAQFHQNPNLIYPSSAQSQQPVPKTLATNEIQNELMTIQKYIDKLASKSAPATQFQNQTTQPNVSYTTTQFSPMNTHPNIRDQVSTDLTETSGQTQDFERILQSSPVIPFHISNYM